jgi:hypothetical protein
MVHGPRLKTENIFNKLESVNHCLLTAFVECGFDIISSIDFKYWLSIHKMRIVAGLLAAFLGHSLAFTPVHQSG